MKEYRGDTKRTTVIGLFEGSGESKTEEEPKIDTKNTEKKPVKKNSGKKVPDQKISKLDLPMSPAKKKSGKKNGNSTSTDQSSPKGGKKEKKRKKEAKDILLHMWNF